MLSAFESEVRQPPVNLVHFHPVSLIRMDCLTTPYFLQDGCRSIHTVTPLIIYHAARASCEFSTHQEECGVSAIGSQCLEAKRARDGSVILTTFILDAEGLATYGKHNLQYGTVVQMPKSWWKAFPPFRRKA